MATADLTHKSCSTCKEVKEVSCFHKRTKALTGMDSQCKDCVRSYKQGFSEEKLKLLSKRSSDYYYANREQRLAKQRAYIIKNSVVVNAKKKDYREKNPEKVSAAIRKWHKEHPERVRELSRASAAREKCIESKKAYQAQNREAFNRRNKAYKSRNPDKVREVSAVRRVRNRRAVPLWADRSAIVQIYKQARLLTQQTGFKHHVDHIVPLLSKRVCGLHCEWNLQILTEKANLTKSNSYWPDMP